VWALSRLMDRDTFTALAAAREKDEGDPSVREEWVCARALEPAIA